MVFEMILLSKAIISGSCSVAGLDFWKAILQDITPAATVKRSKAIFAVSERTICHFSASVMISVDCKSPKKKSLRHPQDEV